MSLTNTDLQHYDSNVLRLSQEKRTEYHKQVDNLVSELRKHVIAHSELKITKVVKAGSFAKYTVLKKTTEDPIDVDVVFYIGGQSVDKSTYDGLNALIHSLLIKFTRQKRSRISKFRDVRPQSPLLKVD